MRKITRSKFFAEVYLIKYRKLFYVTVIILKILVQLITLISPFLYYLFVNECITNTNVFSIGIVVIGYIMLYIFETLILKKLYLKIVYYTGENIEFLRKKITENFMDWELHEYMDYTSMDAKKTIVDDMETLDNVFEKHFLDYYIAVVFQIFIVVILLFLCKELALVSLITYVGLLYVINKVSQKNREIFRKMREKSSELEEFDKNVINNWKDIKTNGIEEVIHEIFIREQKEYNYYLNLSRQYETINRLIKAFKDFFLDYIIIYLIGGILVIFGHIELVGLLTFKEYYRIFLDNITIIQDSKFDFNGKVLPIIQKIASFGKGKEIIRYKNTRTHYSNYNINIQNLTFGFKKSTKLFDNLSIEIPFGEFIAIVGQSGSGKSTISKLLLGELKPQSGGVFIGEDNILTISDTDKSKIISIVKQDSLLFPMTIKENLLMSKNNATEEELQNVCKKVDMLEYIESLPNGFETMLTEDGNNLSGGQKARICLARVLLLDPQIIILDEVTAGLDHETEKDIMNTVVSLRNQKTIILISHNQFAVSFADKILKLSDGYIEEV